MKIASGLAVALLFARVLVAQAQDNPAAAFALMGVKLHMTPEQATQVLKVQSDNVTDHAVSCQPGPAERCRRILAQLPDGAIEVLFRGPPGQFQAVRVVLTVRARGEGDRNAIVSAAIEHYGPPTLQEPAWCTPDASGRACENDAPAMVFRPLAGAAGEFILREASNGDP